MLRDELEDDNSDHQAPGAATNLNNTSLRYGQETDQRARPTGEMKTNRY
jgi:hypothetical protein